MATKVLILGGNGFIGSSLSERILRDTDWEIYSMDIDRHKIKELLDHPRFHFVEGDVTINKEWIAYHVKKCDVILPLVAVATPSVYVSDPLYVFELDFETNLEVVRLCAKYKKHIVFPSTSEVYGMSPDTPFDEEESTLVLGPIHKQRWIYSCSKQLLDRVIYAYGDKQGLNYTLFRPFNWMGPKLDNILTPKEGSARVLTQFIGNIIRGRDIQLVDGGLQRRCFTCIDDGVDALMRIIERRHGDANRRIFNVGNPKNDFSIKELADMLVEVVKTYPKYKHLAEQTKIIEVSSEAYYGTGYQDVSSRVPSVENAKKYLGWEPRVGMKEALKKTLDYHLAHPEERLTTLAPAD
jgi:nucleoside-diphosphate-sugar epimerase